MGRDNYDNEDKFLLSAVCESDRRAFDCIFRRYYVDIVMFCGRYLGRREDCEDIAQTVFLTLWEKRAIMPEVLNLKSWLLRSVQNACLNKLHHQAIVQRYSSEYFSMLPYLIDDNNTSRPLFYSDLVRLISFAEATLGKNEFETWYMSHHQGMKYTEIAIALGISVRTVEDRIARTKNHFRKILNRYWLIVLLFLFLN